MIFLFIISFLVPLLAAYFIVDFFWQSKKFSPYEFIIKVLLSIGLAIGISSVNLFIWLLFFGSLENGFIVAETGLFFILLLIFYSLNRRKQNNAAIIYTQDSGNKLEEGSLLILLITFFLLLATSIIQFIFRFLILPIGTWDAWGIWNTQARILFRAGKYRAINKSLSLKGSGGSVINPTSFIESNLFLTSENFFS